MLWCDSVWKVVFWSSGMLAAQVCNSQAHPAKDESMNERQLISDRLALLSYRGYAPL